MAGVATCVAWRAAAGLVTLSDTRAVIRAVLFDLDNTLIFEDEATFRALRRTCAFAHERAGAEASVLFERVVAAAERNWRSSPVYAYAERMGIWWGEGLWAEFAGPQAMLRALRSFALRFRERTWREALLAVGVSDDSLAAELAERYRDVRRATQLVDPDADGVLADLARDHRLALVTNGAPDVQREKLAGTTLARHFAAIVISCEVGVAKPDPRIFRLALARIGASAAESVMIGDSLARDVAGAKAAGMRAIWIDRGLWGDEKGPRPDARVTALSAVRSALDALEPRAASPRGSRGPRPATARGASRARASRKAGR